MSFIWNVMLAHVKVGKETDINFLKKHMAGSLYGIAQHSERSPT